VCGSLLAGADMLYRADLHCHSTYSDGCYHPIELLRLAHQQKISAISITDHDTLDGYQEEVIKEAKRLGVDLFVGVELSASFQQRTIHVLGYGVKKTAPLLRLCAENQKNRNERNQHILANLSQRSLPISMEELDRHGGEGVIGRFHIAEMMVKKGYVAHVKQAFDHYLGEGKCCFEQGEMFPIQEVIESIHQVNGRAFLAHPHLIYPRRLLSQLYRLNFDGMECYYALLTPLQKARWVKVAKSRNWLISGGSDFHGPATSRRHLGCSWVDRQEVEKIFHLS